MATGKRVQPLPRLTTNFDGAKKMADLNSMRDFHTQLDGVCSALESLFRLASDEHRELDLAASPAMLRFRELLDEADRHIPPE